VLVFDLSSHSTVFRRNPTLSLRPASNEKLTVALAALDRLGVGFQIPTQVLGDGTFDPDTGVWQGRLVLRGNGDPSLTTNGLARLAAQVRAAGIERVNGRILGDETYFDAVRVGPGWKASYYKEESPPLSALVVNRARLAGGISDEPALAAAKLFRQALERAGVDVAGQAVKGSVAGTLDVVAQIHSAVMSTLVRRMNRTSDNFYAEMLLKELGAEQRGSGTTAAGARVVRAELNERNVNMTGVRIADGSGLSAYDRLTAMALLQLLRSAANDLTIKTSFVASLPIAGVNGTLADRMRTGPAYRHVLAKTGTTDRASALSGYATNASYQRRYVFSILMNGNPVPWWYARAAQDRFAQVLARAAQ
jgi:D-alanyl-D-alanine carboxypeptidase/D-alanyl-D-alanine-endopeptidase (penicillin-binding protein 4)